MSETLFREIKITERFTAGERKFVGIAQSFESAFGQGFSDENADALASELLKNSCKNQESYQGLFGLPCLESVRELIFAIVAWPQGLGLDQERLREIVFGPRDLDTRLIPSQGLCRLPKQGLPEKLFLFQTESFSEQDSA
jgi:hypothetical protein